MFFHYLSALRKKPEHVRHNIAIAVSFGITGSIAVIFFLTHIGGLLVKSDDPESLQGSAQGGVEDTAVLVKPRDIFHTENTFVEGAFVAPDVVATTSFNVSGSVGTTTDASVAMPVIVE